MEFQSYTLYYTNEIQKNDILQTIKEHNECIKENNIEHGELFHILNAKMKPTLINVPICDRRYCTYILGGDPIGMIMCCNIGCSSFTFKFFRNLVCMEYTDVHKTYYYRADLEVVDLNNV